MRYILLFILTLAVACRKDVNDGLLYQYEWAQSEKAFQAFKEESGNSYRYMVGTQTSTGYFVETVVTIENGKPVGRDWALKQREDTLNYQYIVKQSWTEDRASLRSHQEGFPPMTLEEIYDNAKYDWLRKRKESDTYFEAKNGGMISTCGYVERGCMDDCFRGVEIYYIESLN